MNGERLIGLAILAGVAIWLAAVVAKSCNDDDCVEWRKLDSMTCIGSENYKTCTVDKECVRHARAGEGAR